MARDEVRVVICIDKYCIPVRLVYTTL